MCIRDSPWIRHCTCTSQLTTFRPTEKRNWLFCPVNIELLLIAFALWSELRARLAHCGVGETPTCIQPEWPGSPEWADFPDGLKAGLRRVAPGFVPNGAEGRLNWAGEPIDPHSRRHTTSVRSTEERQWPRDALIRWSYSYTASRASFCDLTRYRVINWYEIYTANSKPKRSNQCRAVRRAVDFFSEVLNSKQYRFHRNL